MRPDEVEEEEKILQTELPPLTPGLKEYARRFGDALFGYLNDPDTPGAEASFSAFLEQCSLEEAEPEQE
jgi:hypothetical protein